VVLRAHLHVLPLPVAAFLEGHLLAPLLEVAILKFDSVGSDPGEFRRDGITPSFPVAVDLACPFFLLAAVGVAVVRLRCHLLALPNARTAEIVARDIAGLFFDLTVLAPRDWVLNHLLGKNDSEEKQEEERVLHLIFIWILACPNWNIISSRHILISLNISFKCL
jgi:hypothetical protein